MNALDAALAVVVVISTAAGVLRGLVREIFGLVSLVLSLALAYLFGPVLLVGVAGGEAGPLAYLLACAAVFVASLVALSLARRFVTGLLRAMHLGGLDRTLGGLFGVGRALLVTVTALIALVLLFEPSTPLLRESVVLRIEAPVVEWLGTRIPHEGVRREFERRWGRLAPEPIVVTAPPGRVTRRRRACGTSGSPDRA